MANKVIGGTPVGNRSLCSTCRYAQVMRGINMQEEARCLRMGNQSVPITYLIERCSGYDDKRMPSLYDMEQIAWSIKCRVRGQTGFADNRRDVEIEPPANAPLTPRPITGGQIIQRLKAIDRKALTDYRRLNDGSWSSSKAERLLEQTLTSKRSFRAAAPSHGTKFGK